MEAETTEWLLYGLLRNGERDHDLRFLGVVRADGRKLEAAVDRRVQDLAQSVPRDAQDPDRHDDWKALRHQGVLAFPSATYRQIDAPDRRPVLVSGTAAAAMLGMGVGCSWPSSGSENGGEER